MGDPAAIDRKIFGKGITSAVYGSSDKFPAPVAVKPQPRQMTVDTDTGKSRKRDILQKRRRSFATRSNVGDATIKRKTLGGA